MTFDLDPGEGVPWARMQEAAMLVRRCWTSSACRPSSRPAAARGCTCWCRSSGSTAGMRSRASRRPSCSTWRPPSRSASSPRAGRRNRVGKIFVDYLRNGFGATTASAWSARSRPGLGVSVPRGMGRTARSAQRIAMDGAQHRRTAGGRQWSLGRHGEEPQGAGAGDEEAGLRAGLMRALRPPCAIDAGMQYCAA